MVIVVLKWLFLAILAGALTGAVVGGFLLILFKGIVVVDALPPYKYILLPLGMLASVFVITKICPAAAGHGTDRVIATLREWNVQVDETFFLGGVDKSRVLKVFKPHLFFDDTPYNISAVSEVAPAVHVPFGIMNL